MGVPRLSTYPPWEGKLRLKIVYWLGRVSRQFRENWHHNTGTWLWGLDLFNRTD